MTRRMWIALGTVPVLAVLTGAAAFNAWGHGPHGRHGWMMQRMVSSALDEALDQAGVTAEQRTAIHASRDRAFAAIAADAPDRSAHREQMLALFEADQIDPAQVQAVHAGMEQRHQAVRTAITRAIVEIHDTLTPEQRRSVAQFVRSHGPGRWH